MPVKLDYYDGAPAWRIVAPNPARFRGVDYELEFKLFKFPRGALLAAWLRLFDVPERPYFLHRVLDLGDSETFGYMQRLRDAGKIVLLFESKGEQGDFAIELPVSGQALGAALDAGKGHIRSRRDPDGPATLSAFLAIFDPVLRERGDIQRAWVAVERVIAGAEEAAGGKMRPRENPRKLALKTLACGALLAALGWGLGRLSPAAENFGLASKILRPGSTARIHLADELRSVEGRWSGLDPKFEPEPGSEAAFVATVRTHTDSWSGFMTEKKHAAPSFIPYIDVTLRDDPALPGRTFRGTGSVTSLYPSPESGGFVNKKGLWKKTVSIRVFTWWEWVLARSGQVLWILGVATLSLAALALLGSFLN